MNEILKTIDELIDEIEQSDEEPSEEVLNLISEIQDLIKTKRKEKDNQALLEKIDVLTQAVSANKGVSEESLGNIVTAISGLKIEAPQVSVAPPVVNVEVPPVKIPQIKSPDVRVNVPDVKVPPVDLSGVSRSIEKLSKQLDGLKTKPFPRRAKDAISVRLSDGEKHYRAGGGGVSSVGGSQAQNEIGINHFDDATTSNVTYVGREDSSGTWSVLKIDETGSFPIYTYATVINNTQHLTYGNAWNARVSLEYGTYSAAF